MSPFARTVAVAVAGAVVGFGALGVAGTVVGFGFWDFLFSDEKLYGVKLIPQGNPTPGTPGELKVNVEKGKKCNANKHDGCMLFQNGKVGVIGFYLTGPKKKVRCSNDPSKNAGKVITKIELTSTQGASAEKGNFAVNPAPWLRYEAFVGTQADGTVYSATNQTGMSRLALINSNSHQDGQTKSFWYKVTVTDCANPAVTWESDPRGDNEGLW